MFTNQEKEKKIKINNFTLFPLFIIISYITYIYIYIAYTTETGDKRRPHGPLGS